MTSGTTSSTADADAQVGAAVLAEMSRYVAPDGELSCQVDTPELIIPLSHMVEFKVRDYAASRRRNKIPPGLAWILAVRHESLVANPATELRLHQSVWKHLQHPFVQPLFGFVTAAADISGRIELWLEGKPQMLVEWIRGESVRPEFNLVEGRIQLLAVQLLARAVEGDARAASLFQLTSAYARLVTPWTSAGPPLGMNPDVAHCYARRTPGTVALPAAPRGALEPDKATRKKIRGLEKQVDHHKNKASKLEVDNARLLEQVGQLADDLEAEQQLVADLGHDVEERERASDALVDALGAKDASIEVLVDHVEQVEEDLAALSGDLAHARLAATQAEFDAGELREALADTPAGAEAVARWLADEHERITAGPDSHRRIRADGIPGRDDLERAHADLQRAIEQYFQRAHQQLPAVRLVKAALRPRVRVLGSADAIGASCMSIEAGDRRVLVDCGIRWSRTPDDVGPTLRHLGPVDAVIATHAHVDHIGFIPALFRRETEEHRRVGGLSAYGTMGTRVLADLALPEVESRLRELGKLAPRAATGGHGAPLVAQPPPWDAPHLLQMRRAWHDVQPGERREICDHLAFTTYAAGHLPGAVSVLIEHGAQRTFVSSDFSTCSQLTVPGADWTTLDAGDVGVLVLEATHGDGSGGNPSVEREQLLSELATLLGRGGDVIIPAYATGLAQEVIAIIDRGVHNGQLPRGTQLITDGGVVRGVDAYQTLGALPHQFTGIEYVPVTTAAQRDEMLAARPDETPRVIVATSGRGNAGAVARWITAIGPSSTTRLLRATGASEYLHIGEPSRSRWRAGTRTATVALPGEAPFVVQLGSEPRAFWLSAHASLDALLALADHIAPDTVVPVHGNVESIANLTRELQARGHHVRAMRDGGAL